MHNRINHAVTKEVLVQLIVDLCVGPWVKVNRVVCKDFVHHLFK